MKDALGEELKLGDLVAEINPRGFRTVAVVVGFRKQVFYKNYKNQSNKAPSHYLVKITMEKAQSFLESGAPGAPYDTPLVTQKLLRQLQQIINELK